MGPARFRCATLLTMGDHWYYHSWNWTPQKLVFSKWMELNWVYAPFPKDTFGNCGVKSLVVCLTIFTQFSVRVDKTMWYDYYSDWMYLEDGLFILNIKYTIPSAKNTKYWCQKWDSNPRPHKWTRTPIDYTPETEQGILALSLAP